MQYTATAEENALIEDGIAAEALRSDPVFVRVLNALSSQYMQQLLNTKPTQAPEREGLYNLIKATQGIVETLNEWVTIKDELTLKLNQEIED